MSPGVVAESLRHHIDEDRRSGGAQTAGTGRPGPAARPVVRRGWRAAPPSAG